MYHIVNLTVQWLKKIVGKELAACDVNERSGRMKQDFDLNQFWFEWAIVRIICRETLFLLTDRGVFWVNSRLKLTSSRLYAYSICIFTPFLAHRFDINVNWLDWIFKMLANSKYILQTQTPNSSFMQHNKISNFLNGKQLHNPTTYFVPKSVQMIRILRFPNDYLLLI